MRHVGAHVLVGGGLLRALERAAEIGADAAQVFPCNPRAWALPEPDPDGDARARAELERRGWPLFLHVPYLVNPASPDETTWTRSARTLEFSMERARRLGATVIVHAGHCVGADRRHAVARVAAMLRTLLDRVEGVDVALELTAGGSGAVASQVPDAAEALDAVDHHPNLRVCLDTCHLWAAGVDYADPTVLTALRAEIAGLGPGRVAAIHVNDSKDPLGSRRDRHEHLGEGTIPPAAIAALLTVPELAEVTLLTETGPPAETQAREIETIRALVGAPEAARQ